MHVRLDPKKLQLLSPVLLHCLFHDLNAGIIHLGCLLNVALVA